MTSNATTRYRRVLMKVSGSAVAGKEGFGVSSDALDHIANQILSVRDLGIEVAVVTGGGNIFRGNVAAQWESGRRIPPVLTALHACQRLRIDVRRSIATFRRAASFR